MEGVSDSPKAEHNQSCRCLVSTPTHPGEEPRKLRFSKLPRVWPQVALPIPVSPALPLLPGLDHFTSHLQAFVFAVFRTSGLFLLCLAFSLRTFQDQPRKSQLHLPCHHHLGTPGPHASPKQNPGSGLRLTPAGIPDPLQIYCLGK